MIANFRLDKYWSALIVGDFNYPGINWIDGSGFTNSTSSEEQQFADFIMDHYFYQLVDKPTRVNSILDLVLSNSPISIASVESGPSLADVGVPSDHYPVIFETEVKLELKNAGKRHCYVFKNADFDSLNKDLSLLPLSAGVEEISTPEDLNEAWKQWSDLVFAAIDTHISKAPRRGANKPPWINKELAKAINKKKTLWRRIRKSKNAQMLEKFRKLRQSIKNWIRHERKAYLREIANEAFTNPKRFWSYFKFKNKKSPIPESVTLKGVPVSEDQARAKAFNDYFKSIYKNHLCCAVPDTCPLHPDIPELIDAIQVSSAEICELLSTLDTSKATGPDNLPVVILKNCANSLSPSLTAFINASLRSGFYVSEWKQANISPIHKKGSRQEIENYRQISLLPVVAKIQEKCVAKKLIPHINAILHPPQHGFQQGLSCTT